MKKIFKIIAKFLRHPVDSYEDFIWGGSFIKRDVDQKIKKDAFEEYQDT